MEQVAVVIPMYKSELDSFSRQSLTQTCNILYKYPLVVIHPEGLDMCTIKNEFPLLQFKQFKPNFFRGIMGYNRLMLSSELYSAFLDYEYMLICQTDAYIFRDELIDWCNCGYDYVGAPWLRKKVYDMPMIKQVMQLSLWWKHSKGEPSKQDLYNKIGNGGLSLRKVQSHYNVTLSKKELIEKYTNRDKKFHLYNEDVFWALEPEDFYYPTSEEALLFAFDKYPELSYQITGGKLPMGCHAWYKRKMKHFWERFIPTAL